MRERVSNVLELLENALSTGHFGVEKTFERAFETHYCFKNSRKKTSKLIEKTIERERECPTCLNC